MNFTLEHFFIDNFAALVPDLEQVVPFVKLLQMHILDFNKDCRIIIAFVVGRTALHTQ
jgi:hypothetical protein